VVLRCDHLLRLGFMKMLIRLAMICLSCGLFANGSSAEGTTSASNSSSLRTLRWPQGIGKSSRSSPSTAIDLDSLFCKSLHVVIEKMGFPSPWVLGSLSGPRTCDSLILGGLHWPEKEMRQAAQSPVTPDSTNLAEVVHLAHPQGTPAKDITCVWDVLVTVRWQLKRSTRRSDELALVRTSQRVGPNQLYSYVEMTPDPGNRWPINQEDIAATLGRGLKIESQTEHRLEVEVELHVEAVEQLFAALKSDSTSCWWSQKRAMAMIAAGTLLDAERMLEGPTISGSPAAAPKDPWDFGARILWCAK
jgi:hypothetical protein